MGNIKCEEISREKTIGIEKKNYLFKLNQNLNLDVVALLNYDYIIMVIHKNQQRA